MISKLLAIQILVTIILSNDIQKYQGQGSSNVSFADITVDDSKPYEILKKNAQINVERFSADPKIITERIVDGPRVITDEVIEPTR